MRPPVLEGVPAAEAHTVPVAGAASASFAVPVEEIPEPALNALVTVAQAARFLQMPEGLLVDLTKWSTIPCLHSGEERYLRFADVLTYRKELETSRRKERASPLDKVRDAIIAEGLYDTP